MCVQTQCRFESLIFGVVMLSSPPLQAFADIYETAFAAQDYPPEHLHSAACEAFNQGDKDTCPLVSGIRVEGLHATA